MLQIINGRFYPDEVRRLNLLRGTLYSNMSPPWRRNPIETIAQASSFHRRYFAACARSRTSSSRRMRGQLSRHCGPTTHCSLPCSSRFDGRRRRARPKAEGGGGTREDRASDRPHSGRSRSSAIGAQRHRRPCLCRDTPKASLNPVLLVELPPGAMKSEGHAARDTSCGGRVIADVTRLRSVC